jgi:hypothetical protein
MAKALLLKSRHQKIIAKSNQRQNYGVDLLAIPSKRTCGWVGGGLAESGNL